MIQKEALAGAQLPRGEWTEDYVRSVIDNYGISHLALSRNVEASADFDARREIVAQRDRYALNADKLQEREDALREALRQCACRCHPPIDFTCPRCEALRLPEI